MFLFTKVCSTLGRDIQKRSFSRLYSPTLPRSSRLENNDGTQGSVSALCRVSIILVVHWSERVSSYSCKCDTIDTNVNIEKRIFYREIIYMLQKYLDFYNWQTNNWNDKLLIPWCKLKYAKCASHHLTTLVKEIYTILTGFYIYGQEMN